MSTDSDPEYLHSHDHSPGSIYGRASDSLHPSMGAGLDNVRQFLYFDNVCVCVRSKLYILHIYALSL